MGSEAFSREGGCSVWHAARRGGCNCSGVRAGEERRSPAAAHAASGSHAWACGAGACSARADGSERSRAAWRQNFPRQSSWPGWSAKRIQHTAPHGNVPRRSPDGAILRATAASPCSAPLRSILQSQTAPRGGDSSAAAGVWHRSTQAAGASAPGRTHRSTAPQCHRQARGRRNTTRNQPCVSVACRCCGAAHPRPRPAEFRPAAPDERPSAPAPASAQTALL